jgi:hypothetical protein
MQNLQGRYLLMLSSVSAQSLSPFSISINSKKNSLFILFSQEMVNSHYFKQHVRVENQIEEDRMRGRTGQRRGTTEKQIIIQVYVRAISVSMNWKGYVI